MKVGDCPVPLPPFSDSGEARLFVRQLALHLASLDGESVSLATFTLVSVFEGAHGRAYERVTSSDVDLPFLVLQTALLSGFPAPWTPQGVLTALEAGDRWGSTPPSRATTLRWGYDPFYSATRDATGLWTLERSERGTTRVEWTGRSDDEFVRALLDEQRRNPFPYGWRSDDLPGHGEIVRAAVGRRERWDAGAGRLPYLQNWIAERDAAAQPPAVG